MYLANLTTDDVDGELSLSVSFFEQSGLDFMPGIDELWAAAYQRRRDNVVGPFDVGNLHDDVLAFVLVEEQPKVPDGDLPGRTLYFNRCVRYHQQRQRRLRHPLARLDAPHKISTKHVTRVTRYGDSIWCRLRAL
jgi:hypothetical protein